MKFTIKALEDGSVFNNCVTRDASARVIIIMDEDNILWMRAQSSNSCALLKESGISFVSSIPAKKELELGSKMWTPAEGHCLVCAEEA